MAITVALCGKSMAKPQFGDGLYMFILPMFGWTGTGVFFLWRGYHMTIKELLPHTSVDRTHYLLAMRIKHCSIAFRCLNSQPNFAYPYSPGFPWKTGKKNDLPSAKKFPRWQKCSCFLPLGFHDFHHKIVIARWPAGKVSWFDLTRWALGFVVHSRPKRPSELSASNPVTNCFSQY